jgi:hypothetical protein
MKRNMIFALVSHAMRVPLFFAARIRGTRNAATVSGVSARTLNTFFVRFHASALPRSICFMVKSLTMIPGLKAPTSTPVPFASTASAPCGARDPASIR